MFRKKKFFGIDVEIMFLREEKCCEILWMKKLLVEWNKCMWNNFFFVDVEFLFLELLRDDKCVVVLVYSYIFVISSLIFFNMLIGDLKNWKMIVFIIDCDFEIF